MPRSPVSQRFSAVRERGSNGPDDAEHSVFLPDFAENFRGDFPGREPSKRGGQYAF